MRIASLLLMVTVFTNMTMYAAENKTKSLIESNDIWIVDFGAAQKIAKEEGKDLLIEFVSSGWCPWCVKLHEEVFSKSTYIKGATGTFVHVRFIYPKEQARISAKNQKMLKHYGVQGYPTIILADSCGRPYAKTGYKVGGPEAYLRHLNKFVDLRKKRDVAFAQAKNLKNDAKAQKLIDGLNYIGYELASIYYPEVIVEIQKNSTNPTNAFWSQIYENKAFVADENNLDKLCRIIYEFHQSGSTNVASAKIEIEKFINKSIKSKKGRDRALFFKAAFLNKNNHSKEALDILNEISTRPYNFDGAIFLSLQALKAATLCQNGQQEIGIACFKKVITEAKDMGPKAYFTVCMADSIKKMGHKDQAITILKNATNVFENTNIKNYLEQSLNRISNE